MPAMVAALNTYSKPRPPVKWAGGKGQLLARYRELYPAACGCPAGGGFYIEPFTGGGAVFFDLAPEQAILIDSNFELINFYNAVKYQLDELVEELHRHRRSNAEEYYYQVRALDPEEMTAPQRAGRFLYLNKTGFNGLWRVNRKGQHNVPYGKYKNPAIFDTDNLRQVSQALQSALILHGDFQMALEHAGPGDFVYCDPPYHPLSETARFTSYTAEAFGVREQERLAALYRQLDERGCLLMLSNSDTPLIHQLYEGYDFQRVQARRAINCKGERRGFISELVIRNY